MKIAMFPMKISWDHKEKNLKELEESVSLLEEDTDILVLPETFSTGFPVGKSREEATILSEAINGKTIELLKRLASERNIAICGSLIISDEGGISNKAFFIKPNGDTIFEGKRHLFTMAGEHNVFKNGKNRLSIEFKGWKIAMIVCYDIRFPVWCRNKNNEYDLLIAVANWPDVRVDAWNKLLPARAIENEAYICGVNCSGTDNKGFHYDGSSSIWDFKGKLVAEYHDGIGDSHFIYSNLSLDKLKSFREKFPAWKDADSFVLTE